MDNATACNDCPVCLCKYDVSSHRPKVLPCSHTLCKDCIIQLGDYFNCPVCREEISLDLLPLQTDFTLIGKMQDESNDVSEDVTSGDHVEDTLQPQLLAAYDLCCQGLTNIELEKTLMEKEKERNLTLIDEEFDKIINLVNRRRKLIKSQYENVCQSHEEELENKEEIISTNLTCVKKLEETIGKVKHSSRICEIMSGEIEELMENVAQVNIGNNHIEVAFSASHFQTFQHELTTYGSLQYDKAFPASVKWINKPTVNKKLMELSGVCTVLSSDGEPVPNCSIHMRMTGTSDSTITVEHEESIRTDDDGVARFSTSAVHDNKIDISFSCLGCNLPVEKLTVDMKDSSSGVKS